MEVVDRIFRSIFKILLAVMGVLLFCQTMVQSYGQFVFVLLLIITIVVCLRLNNWSARAMAAMFIFVVVPAIATHVWKNTNPLVLFMILAAMSLAAYAVRESRLGRKPIPLKTHGAERTPVLPPERDEQ